MKKLMIPTAFIIVVLMFGCGAQMRNTAEQSLITGKEANSKIVQKLHEIAIVNAMAFTKLQIQHATTQPSDVNKIVNKLSQDLENMRVLYVQHERANGLLDFTGIYVRSRKSWLEQVWQDIQTTKENTEKE